tara:strand:- start:2809 stop:3480 length:672 start_codon:yes stop_codon:yes gene_type:complete
MIALFNSKHLIALCLTLLLISTKALAIESPKYTVIYKDDVVEYRQYEPYIVAETFVDNSSSYRAASNEGFMRLFRYITGNNNSQSNIEMTAPVQQAAASEEIAMTAPVQRVETPEGWSVAFMLPSEFTMETAPLPTDERIVLRKIPGNLMAVVRHSGRWTERNYEKHKEQLLESIEAAAIESVGVVESAAYDAPYVLPFLRRNEVMIEVKSIPVHKNSVATGN